MKHKTFITILISYLFFSNQLTELSIGLELTKKDQHVAKELPFYNYLTNALVPHYTNKSLEFWTEESSVSTSQSNGNYLTKLI
jgi:hypothetical protein